MPYSLFCHCGRRERQFDSQRLQNGECFPDFASLLALFEIDDKAQPCPGSQS